MKCQGAVSLPPGEQNPLSLSFHVPDCEFVGVAWVARVRP